MRKVLSIFVACILVGGCAIGQKTNYDDGEIEFAMFVDDKRQTVYVGFYDERPYVLSGEKDPSFSGLVRSLYGIPYSRHTESGDPLGDDLTDLLVRSLEQQGYNAQPIHFDLRQEIEPALTSSMSGDGLALIYQFREWKTDSMHREVFIYDVTLDVYNSSAEPIASVTDSGRRRINESFHLGRAIKELLDRIHNRPVIQEALNNQ